MVTGARKDGEGQLSRPSFQIVFKQQIHISKTMNQYSHFKIMQRCSSDSQFSIVIT